MNKRRPPRNSAARKTTPRAVMITAIISLICIIGFLIHTLEVAHNIFTSAPSAWGALAAIVCVIFFANELGPKILAHVGNVLEAIAEGFAGTARYLKREAVRLVQDSHGSTIRKDKENANYQDRHFPFERQVSGARRPLWASIAALSLVVAIPTEIGIDETPKMMAPPAQHAENPLEQAELPFSDPTGWWPLPLPAAPFDPPPLPRLRPPIRLAQPHRANRPPIRYAPYLRRQEYGPPDPSIDTYAPESPGPKICLPPLLPFMNPEELRDCGISSFRRLHHSSERAVY